MTVIKTIELIIGDGGIRIYAIETEKDKKYFKNTRSGLHNRSPYWQIYRMSKNK